MNIASIGRTVIVAVEGGDRPAIITKVLGARMVEVTAFMPEPMPIKAVELHADRIEALAGMDKDGQFHAYWPQRV